MYNSVEKKEKKKKHDKTWTPFFIHNNVVQPSAINLS